MQTTPSTTWAFKDRRWTCRQCSFAYNFLDASHCEVCNCLRMQPSLSQPCTITVTEDRSTASASSL